MSMEHQDPVAHELDIAPARHVLAGGREFVRMWRRSSGEVVCLIDPAALAADPAIFGIALVDAVRHGARAWARAVCIPEEEAEQRIWFGLDAERGHPTDLGKEVN